MAYLGNQPVVGDSANTFRLLDDITSFTVTFDATDSDVVSISGDTLTFNNHRFVTGQKVTYNDGGGTAIGGLSDGSYFIIKEDQNTIKLASSASNAAAGTAINLTSGAAGGSHTLNIAQDGVNTKFKATHSNGTKAKISRAAQITLSINGVVQQPTAGYSIESDSTIVFSSAPVSTDKIFASFIGEVAASFDIADNTVDEFTANGSTTTFTLSKTVSSSNDLLVTLDGVTQYPNTQSTTRAYSVIENVLTFTSAPAAGVIIQARHIGFGGASSQSVTGFYGRTGNVSLKSTDDISVNDITVAGDGTVTGGLTVGGNLDVTGDITYDEITGRNLNITGISTFEGDVHALPEANVGIGTSVPLNTLQVGAAHSSFTVFERADATLSPVGSGQTILVGIGTTNPQKTLEVHGNSNFEGDLNVNGSLSVNNSATATIGLVIALGG